MIACFPDKDKLVILRKAHAIVKFSLKEYLDDPINLCYAFAMHGIQRMTYICHSVTTYQRGPM